MEYGSLLKHLFKGVDLGAIITRRNMGIPGAQDLEGHSSDGGSNRKGRECCERNWL